MSNTNYIPSTKLQKTISIILLETQKNTSQKNKPLLYTSQFVPGISITKYIDHICYYASIQENALICALIYIDRYLSITKAEITSHEIHRLFLTSVVLSAKYNYDEFYDNQYYSEVGGITMEEFNNLEKDFLESIEYSLYVSKELYIRYKKAISEYK